MKLTPSRDIHAQVGYLEFYNTKAKAMAGTYEVVEADGEINYAVLNGFGAEEWFSKDEYELALTEQDDTNEDLDRSWEIFNQDDREELMDSWDAVVMADSNGLEVEQHEDGDITDTEFNQYVTDTYRNSDEATERFEQSMKGKTLAEILREQMSKPESAKFEGFND